MKKGLMRAMKQTRRSLSAFLVLCMLLSLLPVSVFAAGPDSHAAYTAAGEEPVTVPIAGQTLVSPALTSGQEPVIVDEASTWTPSGTSEVTGNIRVTLGLTYEQTLATLEKRDIQVHLLQSSETKADIPLVTGITDPQNHSFQVGDLTATVSVQMLNAEKQPFSTLEGATISYLRAEFRGLPQLKYSVKLTGEGYKTAQLDASLEECSQNLFFYTGDTSFSLGDVNNDGAVDEKDCELVADAIVTGDLTYDINGDNKVNVADLAYVHRLSTETENQAAAISGSYLKPPVVLDEEALNKAFVDAQVTIVSKEESGNSGTMADLFQENNTKPVSFAKTDKAAVSDASPISIPITMTNALEMEEVSIVTPDGAGKIEDGSLKVETSSGESFNVPLKGTSAPEGVHAIGTEPGRETITVNLGKRVAVQKITIQVTKAEGGTYATVESIQFHKDVDLDKTDTLQNQIMDLQAYPGPESVTLKWSAVPNVMGYRVDYFEVANPDTTKRSVVTADTTIESELPGNKLPGFRQNEVRLPVTTCRVLSRILAGFDLLFSHAMVC